MSLSLTIQFASTAKTLPARAQIRRWALAGHRAISGEATIRYVDEKEGRALNRDFRGKDYATNVLTFVHDLNPIAVRHPHPNPLLQSALAQACARRFGGGSHAIRNPAYTPPAGLGAHYSADIVICAPVIFREAREQKKTVHQHHAHMVIHGMLHAQGLDHENDVDATAMESLEVQILHRFRIKNPYDNEH
jgi:probable rRNA maturation factor